MIEKCERCEGEGYLVIILKARSVGITTMSQKPGEKIPCPQCGGMPWYLKPTGVTQ